MGGRATRAALSGALACGALAHACAPATRYHMPASVRGYAVYVPGQDSLSRALAQAFRRRGIVVLERLKGGGGPTAALVQFRFREVAPAPARSLHFQLADTRTGAVVAAAAFALDALPSVEAMLDSLGLGPRGAPEL